MPAIVSAAEAAISQEVGCEDYEAALKVKVPAFNELCVCVCPRLLSGRPGLF